MTTHPISIESAGGEYMESVLVLTWSAKVGDKVKAGDLLVTVETAKAATEIEAERDGWLAAIRYREGQEAPVGAVLGTISEVEPGPVAEKAETSSAAAEAPAAFQATSLGASELPAKSARVIASPLARRLAAQAGIDLATVTGSGPGGRIKQRDILKVTDCRLSQGALPVAPAAGASVAASIATPPIVARSSNLPVVLLHGFGADRSTWRQVLPLLGTDIPTLTIDLAGHGSNASQNAESVEELAGFVSERLESEGIEQAHVVGHSLGGATALALASVGRIAIRSMTLLAPGGLGPEIAGGFISGLTRSTTEVSLQRWLAFMLADAAILPQGYARAVLRQMDKLGNRVSMEALAGHLFSGDTQLYDGLPSLARMDVPTRIIWGRSDRVIPSRHASHAPDHAAVHLLSGVGHVPQMEAPALTARLIMETIRSASA